MAGGTYRYIEPAAGGKISSMGLIEVALSAAGVPTLIFPDRSATLLSPGPAPCSFTLPDGSGLVVSPAGVGLVSRAQSGSRFPSILFPEQAIPLSMLAGTWNSLSWSRKSPSSLGQPYMLSYGSLSFSAVGGVSGRVDCPVAIDPAACTNAAGGFGRLVAVDAGGFAGAGTLNGMQAFAYKSGIDTLVVLVDPDGSLTLLTPQAASALPKAGSITSSWGFRSNTAGVLEISATDFLQGITATRTTIVSVDEARGLDIRNSSESGGAAVSHTVRHNTPLPGFLIRDAGPGVTPAILMPLRGMGLTAVSRLGATNPTAPGTGDGFLGLSVSL